METPDSLRRTRGGPSPAAGSSRDGGPGWAGSRGTRSCGGGGLAVAGGGSCSAPAAASPPCSARGCSGCAGAGGGVPPSAPAGDGTEPSATGGAGEGGLGDAGGGGSDCDEPKSAAAACAPPWALCPRALERGAERATGQQGLSEAMSRGKKWSSHWALCLLFPTAPVGSEERVENRPHVDKRRHGGCGAVDGVA